MARQKLFWGAVISAVAPMVIDGFFGGDGGGGARGSGGGGAKQAFLDSSSRESDLAASKLETQRKESKKESKTAEEIVAGVFGGDSKLTGATIKQAEWKNITDTIQNG